MVRDTGTGQGPMSLIGLYLEGLVINHHWRNVNQPRDESTTLTVVSLTTRHVILLFPESITGRRYRDHLGLHGLHGNKSHRSSSSSPQHHDHLHPLPHRIPTLAPTTRSILLRGRLAIAHRRLHKHRRLCIGHLCDMRVVQVYPSSWW
jgi:hypothetical protein